MQQEKYSLTWQKYSDHLRSMMEELMMNEDFSDLTLVTEDKKHIKANTQILSTCSPFLKNILTKERYSNQIMYLRGVQYSELESIIKFIYLGEATFYEERMDEFLAVAKLLELKGLSSAGPSTTDEPHDEHLPNAPVTLNDKMEEKTDDKKQEPQEKEVLAGSDHRKFKCRECKETFTTKSNITEHMQICQTYVKYACDQCDHQATTPSNLTKHIQSIHDGIKYTCDQCDYKATTKFHLKEHIKTKHEGVRYACDQCEYGSSWQRCLTKHIQSVHQGNRYACDECDYQATQQSNLIIHMRSRHEGVRYACDQCDFQATQKSNLTKHIRSKHEGVRYYCDQCNYQATEQSHLKTHIQAKH